MTTIKAQVEIEIFDDPEKCGKCPQLDDERGIWLCGWSRQYLEEDRESNPVKCDHCKAVYKKVKLEEPAESICINGYLFDCKKWRLFFTNRVEAVLICTDEEKERIRSIMETGEDAVIISYDGFINRTGKLGVVEMYKEKDKFAITVFIRTQP